MQYPFEGTRPRLEYMLRGIERDQAAKGQASRTRLPVKSLILQRLRRVMSGTPEWYGQHVVLVTLASEESVK